MVRKTSLALVLALGIAPLSAKALGLGDIQLNSGLNQYLSADIELLSVGTDDINDIKVKLASPEAFERAGVDRTFLLSKLRFKPQQTPQGGSKIRITSGDPIREPFLNFLIEVNWPKGRLVREYTVLLDPPVTLQRHPAPVRTPTAGAVARQGEGGGVESASSAVDLSWAEQASTSPGQYGPTRKNDTLWSIARETRAPGITMEQAMMSVFRANPGAFIGDNINRLKIGEILRVPSAEETAAMSVGEARKAYRAEQARWQADSAAGTGTNVSEPVSSTAPTGGAEALPEAELKIAAARPEGGGEAGPSEGGGDTTKALQDLRQDLLLAEEEKASAQQESGELKSRVDDLESQVQDLQRLLDFKSEQLNRLQEARALAEAGVEQSAQTPVAAPPVPEQGGAEEAQPPAPEPVLEPEPVQTPEAGVAAQPEEPKPAVEPAPAPMAKAPRPEPEKGLLDLLLNDPKMLTIGGVAVVVVLALVWLLMRRRNASSAAEGFQESILVNTIDDTDSEQVTDLSQQDEEAMEEETSFLSDFSPNDIDALQDETGEVDPLTEADVYIAYGRYQQAEELIGQALAKHPERSELKFKLFEILHATKEKDKFVALAEECSRDGTADREPEAWSRVMSMGAHLAATHQLFAGAQPLEEESVDADSEFDISELTRAIDLEDDAQTLSGGQEADPMEDSTGAGGDDLTLGSLDLDDISDLEQSVDEDSDEIDLGIDLDFDGDDEQDDAGDDDATDGESFLPGEGDDFDLGLELEEEDTEEIAVGDTADEISPLDDAVPGLELDGLNLDDDSAMLGDIGLEEVDIGGMELGENEAGVDGDNLFTIEDTLESAPLDESGQGLGDETVLELPGDDDTDLALPDGDSEAFDLDEEALDLGEEMEDDTLGGLLEGGDEDEVNTKLDLARAYIDLGDAEGAREILNEALDEGDDQQKEEAQRLLEELG